MLSSAQTWPGGSQAFGAANVPQMVEQLEHSPLKDSVAPKNSMKQVF